MSYICYTRVCPNDVHPSRWKGMLRWYDYGGQKDYDERVVCNW